MSESDWTDAIVGERMAVDQQFAAEVRDSPFTNQEWGLIMTAAEFDIVDAEDAEKARIVPDTAKVAGIMPEVEKMEGAMGGGPGAAGGAGGDDGGMFSSVKESLGLGGGDGGSDRMDDAEELLERYAEMLQDHLTEKGRWEQVRIAYQE